MYRKNALDFRYHRSLIDRSETAGIYKQGLPLEIRLKILEEYVFKNFTVILFCGKDVVAPIIQGESCKTFIVGGRTVTLE